MWPKYIHHITLHFPIVLSLVLAGIGVWSLKEDTPQFRRLIRWLGWACFLLTTTAVITGIIAAPGWFGGDGSHRLANHRNMGVTTWVVMGVATFCYDWGVRHKIDDFRTFAIGAWCVCAFAVIGTAHWGGTVAHKKEIPWAAHPAKTAPEHVDKPSAR